jgi:hypothetical protein
MVKRSWLWLPTLVLLAGALAAGCAAKTVNHVLADPGRYRDREITIKGSVVDSYSIAHQGIYRVEDRTGALWVVSNHGVPRRGARVKVTGVVREGFNLGALGERLPRAIGHGLVLVETSHRADW